MKPRLSVLEGRFTIHRFSPDAAIPSEVLADGFFSINRTDEELSVVCSSTTGLDSGKAEGGWSCIEVLGPLDFSRTGILAGLSGVLAGAGISIFAVSTFDTDHILVRWERLTAARAELQRAGYVFEN